MFLEIYTENVLVLFMMYIHFLFEDINAWALSGWAPILLIFWHNFQDIFDLDDLGASQEMFGHKQCLD